MARGQPDYGAYSSQNYTANLADLGEHAVRVGSPVIFDRRGEVIDADDLESPILKFLTFTVLNAAVTLDSTYPKSGSQCIKLSSGDGVGHLASITKGFIPLLSQRLGLEFVFANPTNRSYIEIIINYIDGPLLHRGGMRIDFNSQELSYQTGDATWAKFADINAPITLAFRYFPVKLVVDHSTGYFVRALFGGLEFDLSSYPIFNTLAGLPPEIVFIITHRWRAGAISHLYVDDVVLTQGEP